VTHVMIDLETMGNGHDASITQIGAVAFDLEKGTLYEKEFEANVSLSSSVRAGLRMDPSTIEWWIGQGEEARIAWIAGQQTGEVLEVSLAKLNHWVEGFKPEGVWSHGATFDLPILNHAYRVLGRRAVWNFRDARDTRTLFWLCKLANFDPWKEPAVAGEVKHRAVCDARRQARAVIRAFSYLDPTHERE
jgi:hypothetical protein